MLDALTDKLIATLTAEALKSTYGNRAAIENERRSFYAEIVGRLFPVLQEAVRAEIARVTDAVSLAERNAAMATENAKTATALLVSASQTLETVLAAVHSANVSAEAATQAAKLAQDNLESARAEFARLVDRG
jgi:hypothetical protein